MANKYKNNAETAREQSNYAESGRYYTLAAYNSLSECDFPAPKSVTTGTQIGLAIYCFQNAAFTFRLAGLDNRCENRVEQAILVIEDFEEHVFQYDALRGLARECIADLELIRSNETAATKAYDTAKERYTNVTETGWLSESIFEWSLEFFREIMDAADDPISVEAQVVMLNSFDDRVNAKHEQFPSGIENVLESQNYNPGSE